MPSGLVELGPMLFDLGIGWGSTLDISLGDGSSRAWVESRSLI